MERIESLSNSKTNSLANTPHANDENNEKNKRLSPHATRRRSLAQSRDNGKKTNTQKKQTNKAKVQYTSKTDYFRI